MLESNFEIALVEFIAISVVLGLFVALWLRSLPERKPLRLFKASIATERNEAAVEFVQQMEGF
jgi:hypothetical protein